jgi:hypothetical protein
MVHARKKIKENEIPLVGIVARMMKCGIILRGMGQGA